MNGCYNIEGGNDNSQTYSKTKSHLCGLIRWRKNLECIVKEGREEGCRAKSIDARKGQYDELTEQKLQGRWRNHTSAESLIVVSFICCRYTIHDDDKDNY